MNQEEMLRTNFKEHIAEYRKYKDPQGREIEGVVWKSEGSSYYAMWYIMMNQNLFVSGDMGEAVYSWSDLNSIKWVSELDLHYFASKCRASSVGIPFKEWDHELASKNIHKYIKELGESGVQEPEHVAEVLSKFKERGGEGSLYSKDEFINWLHADGYDVFGEDCYAVADMGDTLHLSCEAHWLGLKMAMEQLAYSDNEDN